MFKYMQNLLSIALQCTLEITYKKGKLSWRHRNFGTPSAFCMRWLFLRFVRITRLLDSYINILQNRSYFSNKDNILLCYYHNKTCAMIMAGDINCQSFVGLGHDLTKEVQFRTKVFIPQIIVSSSSQETKERNNLTILINLTVSQINLIL